MIFDGAQLDVSQRISHPILMEKDGFEIRESAAEEFSDWLMLHIEASSPACSSAATASISLPACTVSPDVAEQGPADLGASKGITMTHPNGQPLRRDGTRIRLRQGDPIVLELQRPETLYRRSQGFVALYDGSGHLRHRLWELWSEPFGARNFDFAWKLQRREDGRYELYNDYRGTYLGYDEEKDVVRIVEGGARVGWALSPPPLPDFVEDSACPDAASADRATA